MTQAPPLGSRNDLHLAANESVQHIILADHAVPYVLRCARRRTISLSIDHRGLRVGAPTRTPRSEIEGVIRKHAAWVLQKLTEWHTRRPVQVTLTDKMQLPYLGGVLQIELAVGANRVLWDEHGSTPRLMLGLRSPQEAAVQLEKALRTKARQVFSERLAHFAPCMDVSYHSLTLSSARTRWGCCNRDGDIRLNWRLVHFPLPIIDYVIIHELAHRLEMNHSARFWSIVAKVCPDYKERHRALQEMAKNSPVW